MGALFAPRLWEGDGVVTVPTLCDSECFPLPMCSTYFMALT